MANFSELYNAQFSFRRRRRSGAVRRKGGLYILKIFNIIIPGIVVFCKASERWLISQNYKMLNFHRTELIEEPF